MKTIIIILSVLLSINSFGQTEITKSSISTGGGTATAGTAKIIYTVGELSVNETTQGTVHISEGFINPDLVAVTGLSEYSESELDVSVYPNPASEFVNIQFSDPQNYEVGLYSGDGKIIATYTNSRNILQIPVSNLSSGEYLLIIRNRSNKTFQNFKLIKK